MSGTLGQRSASTGSLPWLQLKYQQQQEMLMQQQQHAQEQQFHNSILVSTPTIATFRKVKGGLPYYSPRDRLFGLSLICRMVSRRKAGMCLLVLVSLLFLLSFLFTLSKDEDPFILGDSANHLSTVPSRVVTDGQLAFVRHRHPVGSPSLGKQGSLGSSEGLSQFSIDRSISSGTLNRTTPVLAVFSLPDDHPCKQFTLPPPPADKKRTGPRPCPVCYLPHEKAVELMPAVPSYTPVLKQLTYVSGHDSPMPGNVVGGSEFGGYTTLKQREEYFNIQESMNIHCGFVKGTKPGIGTGYDLDNADLFDMEQCSGIVVASAIFGNYDELQQPKNISDKAKREVCFFMFVDEETASFLIKTGALGVSKRIGLWRVVVVHNLPYSDPRRNGKIPKLLLHRLFPNARYSLWIDGKLELVVDPYQILERFLWRTHDTFAISRHYRRFDVFDEAEANKAAGKYSNASIDAQIEFYRREGLTHYSSSKYPITSDVPEGCVIVREHTPITNLFTCLWFNEVDRFTSRDQISFAIVRDKIMSRVNWRVNMFLDCERRNFVVQAYHRDILEKRRARMAPPLPKPELPKDTIGDLPKKSLDEPARTSVNEKFQEKNLRTSGRKSSMRHTKDRRTTTSRHRKTRMGSKGTDFR